MIEKEADAKEALWIVGGDPNKLKRRDHWHQWSSWFDNDMAASDPNSALIVSSRRQQPQSLYHLIPSHQVCW